MKIIKISMIFVLSISFCLSAGISGCSKEEEKAAEKTPVEKAPAASEERSGSRTLNVTVYAYCPCAKCNTNKWKGMVATGKKMKDIISEGKNICAADPDVIPLGSTITYNDEEYLVADTGSKIKGNKINILLKNHKQVEKFGVKKNQPITVEE